MSAGVRRLAVVAVAAAAIAAGIVAWRHYATLSEVAVSQPQRGTAVQAVYATGTVEAVHWAKVTPLVPGRIVELCACEGQEVNKGDFLARLDDREARALIAELTARETFLAGEVRRYRELLQRKVVSASAYERVASDWTQARAATAAARERLAQLTLKSPMDGVVLRRDGEVGEVVGPDFVMFWVGKPLPLRITAEVDEEDIPLVRIGQRAMVKADAFPGQVLEGQVEHITPKGDPVTKSYRVRIALPDDTPLIMGMTTENNVIVREEPNALLVPSGAVVAGRVWVVEDGRALARKIETGIVGDRWTQITDGLTEADRVVIDPPPDFGEGPRIRVRPATEAAR